MKSRIYCIHVNRWNGIRSSTKMENNEQLGLLADSLLVIFILRMKSGEQ